MTRPRPGIGSELLPLLLIMFCMAGSWYSIVAMHRRGSTQPEKVEKPERLPSPGPVASMPVQAATAAPPPSTPESPAPPLEDPTEKALRALTLAQADQLLEAQFADRKAAALETARQAAVADSQRARRRESVVRNQIDALSDQATRLHDELSEVALERDVLARERDAARAALTKARTRSSYAVLPHKGANGTWQRPIVIECHNGTATIQPGGPSFSLIELSGLFGPRSTPMVAAVAREVVRVQSQTSPDGAPVVPYIYFVIRPDGIRPYYNARGQLEPLGIAFGYELVDQQMEIDYPDLDDIGEWDGTNPSGLPRGGAGNPLASTRGDGTSARPWPSPARRESGGTGRDEPADSFVWPTRPGGGANASANASSSMIGTENRNGTSDTSAQGRGPSANNIEGMGRGGNGLDPTTSGIPIIDLDRIAGVPAPPSPVVGRGRGAGEPGSPSSGGMGLVPINPESMPGLTSTVATANPGPPVGGPGQVQALDPRTLARAAGSLPQQGTTPLPPIPAGSPLSALAGHIDPDRGAPPALSALARLAAGATGASSDGKAAGTATASPSSNSTHFGAPMPLPISPGFDHDEEGSAASGASGGQSDGQPGGRSGGSAGRADRKAPLSVEVPFEIVVACNPDGVVIHPGGYRLSAKALRVNDGRLMSHLKSIVQARRQVDPMIRPVPSIRFLIEPGGSEAYRDARRQTMMSGQNWPVALQVSDSSILDIFKREPW